METLINALVSALEASFPGWTARGLRDFDQRGVKIALYRPSAADRKVLLVLQEFVSDADLVVLSLNEVTNRLVIQFSRDLRTMEEA